MNKRSLAIEILVSFATNLAVNFFTLRGVLRRVHRPWDRRQQTRLAAVLAAVFSVSTLFRLRKLAELAESQPSEAGPGDR